MRISDWSSDVCSSDLLVYKVKTQQGLINLIRNAMEAMSGSPVRQLVISSRIQDRQFVRVSVEDSGPGVPKAIAENLFRAFVSTKAQGMGLGLSICRTIIEANGGRIWLEPRSGGGSIFHFTQIGRASRRGRWVQYV